MSLPINIIILRTQRIKEQSPLDNHEDAIKELFFRVKRVVLKEAFIIKNLVNNAVSESSFSSLSLKEILLREILSKSMNSKIQSVHKSKTESRSKIVPEIIKHIGYN